MCSQLAQFPVQVVDASADGTPVFLKLGFTWSAGANATPLPRQAQSAPRKPRQSVAKLGQFDLKASSSTGGSLGKDVEDQLTPIHHRAVQQSLQVSRLNWCQFSVGDDQRCTVLADVQGRFLQLAGAPECLRIDLSLTLSADGNRSGTGTARQSFKFGQFTLVPCLVCAGESEQQHLLHCCGVLLHCLKRFANRIGMTPMALAAAQHRQIACFTTGPAAVRHGLWNPK